jgi:hypothetical protein
MVLGSIHVKSTSILSSTCFGSTFKVEPLSTNTFPMMQALHLTMMYRGLLWPVPLASILSSVKYNQFVAWILLTRCFIVFWAMSWGTYALFNTFCSVLWWGSKLRIKDIKDILAGVFFSYFTILYSLFFISFKNSSASSSLMGSFISISLMTSITSLPLTFHCLSSSFELIHQSRFETQE